MKKAFLALLLVGVVGAVPAQAQAPTTFAFGTLITNDGTKDFAWFYGGNFNIVNDEELGLTNFGRLGYFRTYTALDEDETQSGAGWNITSKRIKQWGNNNLYVNAKIGALWNFQEGADDMDAAVGLELGAQLGSVVYLGLGADYQPVKGEHDKEFVYAIVNLFP